MSYKARRGYAESAVETMAPDQVLRALYARLIRDLDEAITKIRGNDAGGKGLVLNHAHQICSVLVDALDRAAAPELCDQLAGLYDYVLERISHANSRMDPHPLVEARRVVVVLQDAFEQIARGIPMTAIAASTGAR